MITDIELNTLHSTKQITENEEFQTRPLHGKELLFQSLINAISHFDDCSVVLEDYPDKNYLLSQEFLNDFKSYIECGYNLETFRVRINDIKRQTKISSFPYIWKTGQSHKEALKQLANELCEKIHATLYAPNNSI